MKIKMVIFWRLLVLYSIYFGKELLEFEVKGRVGRMPVKLRKIQKSQSIPEIQED